MIKRAVYFISILSAFYMCGSCGRAKSSGSDSIYAEAGEEVSEDIETPDLAWYDLRGPVENCVIELSATVDTPEGAASEMSGSGSSLTEIRFSRQGMLVGEKWISRFDDSQYLSLNLEFEYDAEGNLIKGKDSSVKPALPVTLQRNAYGEVTELRVGDDDSAADNCFTMQIEWGSGRVAATEMRANELVRRMVFRYSSDSSGAVSAEFSSDDIEEATRGLEEYEYVSTDNYGNWTERKVKILTKVKNYESPGDSEREFTSYRVEKRSITYYNGKDKKY